MDYLNYKNAFKVFRLNLAPFEHEGEMVDPRAQLPEATCAMLILQGYAPYLLREGKPHLSAHAVAANRVHQVAARLAEELDKEHKAVHAKLPLRSFLEARNIGRRGVNGFVGTEDLGTYFSAQVVLTDMFPAQEYNARDKGCMKCMRCVRVCPTKALSKEGCKPERCIRNYLHKLQPIPGFVRAAMPSLKGCDLCQLVCPRNEKIKPYMMPEELDRIFTYHNILLRSGKLKDQFVAALGAAERVPLRSQTLILAAKDGLVEYSPVAEKLLGTVEDDAARFFLDNAQAAQTAALAEEQAAQVVQAQEQASPAESEKS